MQRHAWWVLFCPRGGAARLIPRGSPAFSEGRIHRLPGRREPALLRQARSVVGNVAQAGSHSAAGQMTRYLYQCELALLELARHSWQDATTEVRMELLDDIEFLNPQESTPRELLVKRPVIPACRARA